MLFQAQGILKTEQDKVLTPVESIILCEREGKKLANSYMIQC